MNPVLKLRGLGKMYRAYPRPTDRLKRLLGLPYRSQAHWALQDVSFELQRGQCMGIVGDNGAGKSTLLKLLAGTLTPTRGQLEKSGRLTAILELGAGFHPEFTGRQNLYYAAPMMGISDAQLRGLEASIIEFAELTEAMDRPLKTYSSGMVVRLAFALVTAIPPDVLIIDEALAVGDQHFQKKCVDRIQRFVANGCTVLFCSHSLYHIRQLCDHCVWIHQGRVQALGDTDSVLARYENHVALQAEPQLSSTTSEPTRQAEPVLSSAASANPAVQLLSAELLPSDRSECRDDVWFGPDLCLRLRCKVGAADEQPPSFGVMIEKEPDVGIASMATHADGATPERAQTQGGQDCWQIVLTFPELPLHSGRYRLSVYLFDASGLVVLDEWRNHIVFDWQRHSLTPGLVFLPHTWHGAADTAS
ncbi:MAG: ABC transporter ATP-binding protein [Rhodoferax sp.]